MSNLIQANSFPSAQEFQTMKDLGNMAVKSGFLPTSINTAEKAVIIMLKGRELGIPPMQAFSSIAVVNGKPTMAAELMLSMIFKNVPGAVVDFEVTDTKKCEITAKRPNGKATKFSFTMDDAKTAGLADKGPWKQFPAAMLRARCVSAMARAMFPDALSGVVYTPEELGAEVDDEGNVMNAFAETPKEKEARSVVEAPESLIPEVLNDVDLGSFVCDIGKKYKGMMLKDIGENELNNYLNWLTNSASQQGSVHPSIQIFMDNAEAYLKSREFGQEEFPA